jgi:hypothetical protein
MSPVRTSDSLVEGDGLPHCNKNIEIDWQTALSARTEIKGLFRALANRDQVKIVPAPEQFKPAGSPKRPVAIPPPSVLSA